MIDKVKLLEERFKVVCSSDWNLSKYPLTDKDDVQFNTDKDKSRIFAEVFTPLHIVDQMLDTVPQMTMMTRNLDLCSGFGQFSIRIIRKLVEVHGAEFNVGKYLMNNHFFAELQVSSCYKLLSIFSTAINLFIGDALQLGKLPANAKGIWVYLDALDEWVNVTRFVKALFSKISPNKKAALIYDAALEERFVKEFNAFVTKLTTICKDYKMNIKEIARTKEGRLGLMDIMRDTLNASKLNWQGVKTPEDIVREMVRSVPDVKALRKILVLFNIEFLECLIKEMGVDPSCVTMISDTEVESEFAKKIYGVYGTVIVEHTLEGLKKASSGCEGFDVIFSNPPYQIQSESQKNNKINTAVAQPIYHEIVTYAIDSLKPRYLCMITPSRWMAGGKGLNDYRTRMLADKRIKTIVDFPGTRDVFKTVSINGGVSYFLWDRDYNGLCTFNGVPRDLNEFDVLVRDITSCQILCKVIVKTTTFCNDKVFSTKPFGLATNFNDWVHEGTVGAVECMASGKVIKLVDSSAYTDTHNVKNLWKVLVNPVTMEGSSFVGDVRQLLMGFMIISPDQICTETYIVAGAFPTQKEAENYAAYMKTKFYRYMLSLRIISQRITREKFAWVPDLGDYSHTYTDKDLYAHFGLTKKEIEHIEKGIKTIK